MQKLIDRRPTILTEQRFLRMTETLEQEQTDNKARMQAITELDETILNRLIDKIFISVVEVIDGEKVQKVRIVYNFVGVIAN